MARKEKEEGGRKIKEKSELIERENKRVGRENTKW